MHMGYARTMHFEPKKECWRYIITLAASGVWVADHNRWEQRMECLIAV